MINNTAAAVSTYVNDTAIILRKGKGYFFKERNLTSSYLHQKLADGFCTEKQN